MSSSALVALISLSVLLLVQTSYAGTMYGLSILGGTHLVTINPQTGNTTDVGPILPGEDIAQQLASIDETRKILYYITFDESTAIVSLIGLYLSDGKIKYNIPLPIKVIISILK